MQHWPPLMLSSMNWVNIQTKNKQHIQRLGNKNNEIYFDTLSGRLSVQKTNDGRLQMNFPQYNLVELESSFGSFNQFEKVCLYQY